MGIGNEQKQRTKGQLFQKFLYRQLSSRFRKHLFLRVVIISMKVHVLCLGVT